MGNGSLDFGSREAATEFRTGIDLKVILSPLRGSITLAGLTQGSQSLALGLTLIAAPQLNEFLVKAEME